MERHIVEILVILMREYPEGAIRPEEFEPLANDLIGLGYTQQEIEAALFWFYNRQEIHQNRGEDRFQEGSFRFLHDAERSILSPEAYGYILELHQLDLITLSEMDAIIERAVLLGGRKVDVDDIKMFIASMIMDQSASFSQAAQNYMLKTTTDRIH